jgi:hypothetical protein
METRLKTRRKDSEKEVAALQLQIVTRATVKRAQEAGLDPEFLTRDIKPPAAKRESLPLRGLSQKAKARTKRQRDTRSVTPRPSREVKRGTRAAAKTAEGKGSPSKGDTGETGPSPGKDIPADPKPSSQQADSAAAMDRRQRTSGDGSSRKDTSAEEVSMGMYTPCIF